MVQMDVSTLSRLVGTMKTRRLVSRRRQENDERSVRISLTAEGRALIEQLVPRAVYYENLAVRNFAASEIDDLKSTLLKIQENVSDLQHHATPAPAEKKRAKLSRPRKFA